MGRPSPHDAAQGWPVAVGGEPGGSKSPCVPALLERLRGRPGTTLGLLTGNYPETGALKLRAAGLDPEWFPVAAWGDDGEHRRDLPGVAMRRFAALVGREAPSERVVVIGDTPLDVDCARASGCRSVAVASGPSFTRDDLAGHAPDLLLDDLRDAERLVAWLADLDGTRASR